MTQRLFALLAAVSLCSCAGAPAAPRARNLLLITVDTLRADRIGAYGYARARTPRLDGLARSGAVFDRAFAAAPITLPSHATILSGRYPPGHGARDNGMKVSERTPTLATELKARGFRTGAFVAAFPLDHQFGLNRGFDVYSDRLPRDRAGRQSNERPAADVVNEAIAWLGASAPSSTQHPAAPSTQHPAPSTQHPAPSTQHPAPFFLWLHLFEPHAPYEGDLSRPAADRYDDEVAVVDREIGRLLDALGPRLQETLVVATADHGEAFGEHGEYAHSIFVYDTTLRVPLTLTGPGVGARRIAGAVTLADVAPTAMKALGFELKNVDGVDLTGAASGGAAPPARELYAESFAPLVEFGWAPLRAVRSGALKYIAAPRPELYDVERDPGEDNDLATSQADVARGLERRVNAYSPDTLDASAVAAGGQAAERLRALGYAAGSRADAGASGAGRPDPKDRKALAARIAQVTAGELQGAALLSALEGIARDDPRNGQVRLRLGYARLQAGDCAGAEREFHAAIAGGPPSADPYLGLAACLGQRRDLPGAERALSEARRIEPDNSVVTANIGILKAERGDHAGAIEALRSALAADPNLHEARFNLALVYARTGRRQEAITTARELLGRLPAQAPQRAEIGRLLKALEAP